MLFWVVTSCRLVGGHNTNVSEKHTVSIFRAEECKPRRVTLPQEPQVSHSEMRCDQPIYRICSFALESNRKVQEDQNGLQLHGHLLLVYVDYRLWT
jgi:hypothetical protein